MPLEELGFLPAGPYDALLSVSLFDPQVLFYDDTTFTIPEKIIKPAEFSGVASAEPGGNSQNIFESDEKVYLDLSISPDINDVGLLADIFVLAYIAESGINDGAFQLTEGGEFQKWDGTLEGISAYLTRDSLSETEKISVHLPDPLTKGVYSFYWGYSAARTI